MPRLKKYSETKIGKVSNIRWACVTQVKMGRYVDKQQYLIKALEVIAKGTRFQEHIDAIKAVERTKIKRR